MGEPERYARCYSGKSKICFIRILEWPEEYLRIVRVYSSKYAERAQNRGTLTCNAWCQIKVNVCVWGGGARGGGVGLDEDSPGSGAKKNKSKRWMDDLRFYVLSNSVSTISGRWEVDNERLCAADFLLRVRRFRLERGSNLVR